MRSDDMKVEVECEGVYMKPAAQGGRAGLRPRPHRHLHCLCHRRRRRPPLPPYLATPPHRAPHLACRAAPHLLQLLSGRLRARMRLRRGLRLQELLADGDACGQQGKGAQRGWHGVKPALLDQMAGWADGWLAGGLAGELPGRLPGCRAANRGQQARATTPGGGGDAAAACLPACLPACSALVPVEAQSCRQ